MLEECLKTQHETARWADGIAGEKSAEVDHIDQVSEILPVELYI